MPDKEKAGEQSVAAWPSVAEGSVEDTLMGKREAASDAVLVSDVEHKGQGTSSSERKAEGHQRNHLLVPVDGSDEGLSAVKWTLENMYRDGGWCPATDDGWIESSH